MKFIIKNTSPPSQSCPAHFQLSKSSSIHLHIFNTLILLFLYFPILDIILQKEWQLYSLTPFIPNIVCLFVLLFFLNHLSVFITK